MRHVFLLLILLLFIVHGVSAQAKRPFFRPDTTLNKTKVWIAGGSTVGIYTGALVVLNEYWYKGYPRSRFHFFNDSKEWMGIDKCGHIYSSYVESRWATGIFRWTGMKERQAIWIGGMTGAFLQTSIEILDGFSEKWGFSGYDILANTAGSMMVIGQELAWKEQRITLKISAFPQSYPDDLRPRAKDLFGNTAVELFLKDYNAITTWASVSIGSFIKKPTKFPKWICVSVGYGANGLYGGFENRWCKDSNTDVLDCDPANVVDRTDVRRYPQFYLSMDVDFTKIKTRSPVLKSLFNVINVIKVPFPAVEFNPVDKVKVHPIFF
ncbi:MAG: DUF2279 domain-containing protein [Chitinophagales bacterium]|nr:DUF2279 domain-containing protein [Chitinophagales bacterium]